MVYKIPVRLSNRHCHLTPETLKKLFGDTEPTFLRYLSEEGGPFAYKETLTICGPKGEIRNVRFLGGPQKPQDQVELLQGDNFILGIDAPLKMSGELEDAATATLVGPAGEATIKAFIIAKRHIHLSASIAEELGIVNDQIVQVKCGGERGLIFDNVVVRLSRDDISVMHIDFDEANAAGLKNFDEVELVL